MATVIILSESHWLLFTPRYSWNTTKVGVKHQSIISYCRHLLFVIILSVKFSLWTFFKTNGKDETKLHGLLQMFVFLHCLDLDKPIGLNTCSAWLILKKSQNSQKQLWVDRIVTWLEYSWIWPPVI